MKIKIRPDDTGPADEAELVATDHWLARLREDDRTPQAATAAAPDGALASAPVTHAPVPGGEPDNTVAAPRPYLGVVAAPPPARVAPTPADPWPAVPLTPADPWPAVPAAPLATQSPAPEPQVQPAQTAEPQPAEPEPAEPEPEPTVRAVIGDELRVPTTWCEMGRCISSYVEPGALGEADNRAHAMAAGWRLDAFNRLACPSCQERDASFRSQQPVVPWDRRQAMATATRMTAPPVSPGPLQAGR